MKPKQPSKQSEVEISLASALAKVGYFSASPARGPLVDLLPDPGGRILQVTRGEVDPDVGTPRFSFGVWRDREISGASDEPDTVSGALLRVGRGFVAADEFTGASERLFAALAKLPFELIAWTGPLHGGAAQHFRSTFGSPIQIGMRAAFALDALIALPFAEGSGFAEHGFRSRELNEHAAGLVNAALEGSGFACEPVATQRPQHIPSGSQWRPAYLSKAGTRVDALAALKAAREAERKARVRARIAEIEAAAGKLSDERAKLEATL